MTAAESVRTLTWEDHHGRQVDLDHAYCCGPGGCVRLGQGAEVFHLPVSELAGHVRELYQAAGLPAPVILDRPEPRADLAPKPGGGSWVEVRRSCHPANPDRPAAELGVRTHADDAVRITLIGDEPLRVALALVDAMREPESEPDPAEVEELTGVLVQAGAGLRSTGVGDIALAALRWMNGRQQGEGSRDG